MILINWMFRRFWFVQWLTLLTVLNLHAQSYSNGYIILLKGDTVNGIVSTTDNYSSIRFKLQEYGMEKEFTPDKIKGYSLFANHQVYFSIPITLNGVSEYRFLQALILGDASLFQYRDPKMITHYFLSKDTSFVELKNDKKIALSPEGTHITYDNSYLDACNLLLGDCPSGERVFAFSKHGLIQRIKRYNKCIDKRNAEFVLSVEQNPNDIYSKFISVKIVKISGDTLRGYVRYYSDKELNAIIRFRKNINDEDILLKPEQLVFFELGNKRHFESVRNIEFYPDVNKDDMEVIPSVFAEMIVKGKVSLFKLKDRNNNQHIFISKEGKALELRIKTYKVDGRTFNALLYNGILNIVLGDCGRTASYNIVFKLPFLIRAVVESNDCRHSKSIVFYNGLYSQKINNQ